MMHLMLMTLLKAANHFKCIDMIIDNAKYKLTEKFIKQLHFIYFKNPVHLIQEKIGLMWASIKKLPNEVGGKETAKPEDVATKD